MRLNRRFAVLVGCSVLWPLIAAASFHRVAAAGSHRAAPGRGKALVVASQALPLGAVVGRESVKMVEVPENLFPKGAFTSLDEVLERPVISPIEMDEPVVAARL